MKANLKGDSRLGRCESGDTSDTTIRSGSGGRASDVGIDYVG